MNNIYYFARDMLWVLPPKNASTSIKTAIGAREYIGRDQAEYLNAQSVTVGCLRHPYDRAVSALYTVHMNLDDKTKTLRARIHDSHLRPQSLAFAGLRIDHWLRFDRLAEDWRNLFGSDLEHLNIGSRNNGRPNWHDAEIDWGDIYHEDLELWRAHA